MAQERRGSFWWRDSLKLLEHFKGMASVIVQSGTTCFFWLDVWNDHLLSHDFPHLFSYVKDQKLTVLRVAQATNLSDIFHLPLSEEAFQQFRELGVILNDLHLQDETDKISGALQFSLLKGLINILEAPYKFIQCLGGYGKLLVRTKETFSFGYCLRTG
jgi:hypothetical protein